MERVSLRDRHSSTLPDLHTTSFGVCPTDGLVTPLRSFRAWRDRRIERSMSGLTRASSSAVPGRPVMRGASLYRVVARVDLLCELPDLRLQLGDLRQDAGDIAAGGQIPQVQGAPRGSFGS